jgi:WD repeat and SOF domain-containing protein 1
VSAREKHALQYADELKERYKHHPEVKRIARHRHVPKAIKKAAHTKRAMLDADKRKKDNLRKHSKPGKVPYKAERQKHVVSIQD